MMEAETHERKEKVLFSSFIWHKKYTLQAPDPSLAEKNIRRSLTTKRNFIAVGWNESTFQICQIFNICLTYILPLVLTAVKMLTVGELDELVSLWG